MNLEEIKETYRKGAADARRRLGRTQRQIARISTARVALFVAGVAGAFYYGTEQWALTAGVIAATLVPFVLLMKLHNRKFWQKAYQEQEVAVNEQELAALDYRYDGFEAGEEFADPTHLYSYDLDLFGQQSLFQYLNRTCTQPGRTRLAAWLGHHLLHKTQFISS